MELFCTLEQGVGGDKNKFLTVWEDMFLAVPSVFISSDSVLRSSFSDQRSRQ